MTLLVLALVSAAAGCAVGLVALRYPEVSPTGRPTLDIARAAGETVAHHSRLRAIIDARRHPGTATGLFLTLAGAVTVAGAVVVGVLAYLVRSDSQLVELDRSLSRWADDSHSPFALDVLEAITHLGETAVVIGLAVAITGFEFFRTRDIWIAPFLTLVIAGNFAIYNTIKELADRVRPTLNPIAETLGPSFPSGHSATAAAFFAAAALVLGRRRARPTRAVIAAAAAAIAVAVACSRLMLNVHWMSDVVGGLAVGWAWFAICAIAFGGRLLRFGATAELAGAVTEQAAAPQPTGSTDARTSLPR